MKTFARWLFKIYYKEEIELLNNMQDLTGADVALNGADIAWKAGVRGALGKLQLLDR